MSETTKDRFISELHKLAGLCGHCGKKNCAARSSNSYLPEMIPVDQVIKAIDNAVKE